MADEKQQQRKEGGQVSTDVKTADLPISTPDSIQTLAADLPERDPVQEAHKEILTTDSPQAMDKAKAKLVDESRDAYATPSGYAAKKVAGISNDTERGEEYDRQKSAVRWGTLPDDA